MESKDKLYRLDDIKNFKVTITAPKLDDPSNDADSIKFGKNIKIWAENSLIQLPDVYLKPSKLDKCFLLPTLESLLETTPHLKVFGKMNEIEYSSNAMFKEPILPEPSRFDQNHEILNGVVLNLRQYWSSEIDIFFNNDQFSTKYFEGSRHELMNVITRVDSLGSPTQKITAKLRVVRSKFNCRDAEFVLTGAIEVSLDKMVPLPSIKSKKTKHIIYWNVVLTHEGTSYQFRVAFRNKIDSNSPYVECNIECEDENIDGHIFSDCFYILYVYYKHQYESCNRRINPIYHDCDFNKLSNLTENQKKIAATIKQVPCRFLGDEKSITIDYKMQQFVKFLGLLSYLNFVDDDAVQCLESFDRLTFAEYKINDLAIESKTLTTNEIFV